jgi:hypothetical protein
VFFAGGDDTKRLLAKLCNSRGLSLLADTAAADRVQARWDQLRACNFGVFDLTSEQASVCYDLGVALTLGRPAVITARHGTKLPFDIDVKPVWLVGGNYRREVLSKALDQAMYGLQRTREGTSVATTVEYLRHSFARSTDFRVAHIVKSIDGDIARDPVAARRRVEDVIGTFGANTPLVIFPPWPVSYPSFTQRRCFHVTPFGPTWATITTEIIEGECRAAGVEYIRGDRALEPEIIRSIWDNICTATHITVDLTGLNPNVALELGMARTLGRNILLLTQDQDPERYFPAISKLRIQRYACGSDAGLELLRKATSDFLRTEGGAPLVSQ